MWEDEEGFGGWMLLWEGVGCEVCPAAPASAPGIPRVLASLARAPFVGDERGSGFLPSQK